MGGSVIFGMGRGGGWGRVGNFFDDVLGDVENKNDLEAGSYIFHRFLGRVRCVPLGFTRMEACLPYSYTSYSTRPDVVLILFSCVAYTTRRFIFGLAMLFVYVCLLSF